MTASSSAGRSNTSLTRDLLHAARYYLGGRRGILILATIVVVVGVALNWSWLVASGIAPILLTALPCAVMCGLGLCMNKLFGNSCETQPSQPGEAAGRTAESSAPLLRSATTDRAPSGCHESADTAAQSTPKQTLPLQDRRDPHA
jgi:hypothetical protein